MTEKAIPSNHVVVMTRSGGPTPVLAFDAVEIEEAICTPSGHLVTRDDESQPLAGFCVVVQFRGGDTDVIGAFGFDPACPENEHVARAAAQDLAFSVAHLIRSARQNIGMAYILGPDLARDPRAAIH